MTMRSSMLDIAREVINARAVYDGYPPFEYDAERDEEGYVVSILNGLHHWCGEHGIDWQAELARAQEHFNDDMQEEQESQP